MGLMRRVERAAEQADAEAARMEWEADRATGSVTLSP